MIEKICVVGQGYVGTPLAIAFGRCSNFEVVGFDIDSRRIKDLRSNVDRTMECTEEDFLDSRVRFSDDINDISDGSFYVVAVPTPIDGRNSPDLSYLESACKLIGPILSNGNVVVFESTVFPGCTEDFCVPILERGSGLLVGEHFEVGYSPERINPGDRARTVSNVVKVVSASSSISLERIKEVYETIVLAGVYEAPSIKVAEAAKVIENIQRDVNVALMNEFSTIFQKMSIDTYDVLAAAKTKWNFLDFSPGLVGGHCIGIDPYYLAYSAKKIGIEPKMILAGRSINETFVDQLFDVGMRAASQALGCGFTDLSVLVLGLTFKENCADLRNSKALNLLEMLVASGASVTAYDPFVSPSDISVDCLVTSAWPDGTRCFDLIYVLVAHEEFKDKGVTLEVMLRSETGKILDLKNMYGCSFFNRLGSVCISI